MDSIHVALIFGSPLRSSLAKTKFRILPVLIVFFLLSGASHATPLRISCGDQVSGWEEKIFNGQVDYQAVIDDGRQVLQAESKGKASALIYRLNVDPHQYPKLRWRWKIDKILEKGHAGQKAGDDYPARVYIIFDSWLPNYARSINYIWASKVDRETLIVSPYYRRSIMLAVNSGPESVGRWVIEERDLLSDYKRAFGGKIPLIKAIAIMSDGDNTGESSMAWYDWVEFLPANGKP